MNEEQTDMHRIARDCAPAAMPADMRRRLLRLMLQEDAELQADKALEDELLASYAAAPMPQELRRRLVQSAGPAPAYRAHGWWRAVAALLVALLVLPLLWWGLRPARGAASPVVEVRREILLADEAAPAVRCDTFVMQEPDQSRLVIKVKDETEPQLPEDVI